MEGVWRLGYYVAMARAPNKVRRQQLRARARSRKRPTPPCVDKRILRRLVAKTFEEMGIRGVPVGAERVQELVASCEALASEPGLGRSIVDMRDE